MGNIHDMVTDTNENVKCKETNKNKSTKLKRFTQCKIMSMIKPQKHMNTNDTFIMKYIKNNKQRLTINDSNYLLSIDNRRYVFVSLMGLFNTWKDCPSHVLYSSIFILPLKRKWLYNLLESRNELIGHAFISQHYLFQQNIQETQEFIEMLKWKDAQNLVFWMMDKYEMDSDINTKTEFTPFWVRLSEKFTTLNSSKMKKKYNPIILDEKWWKHKFAALVKPKYENNVENILCELRYLSNMNYKAIQEIIYQSNPYTLNPVISYSNDTNKIFTCKPHFFENIGNGWFIADDYKI
eukprot:186521_1